jgi:uncharacterized membrane protein YdbT with pleckstrin-like domain
MIRSELVIPKVWRSEIKGVCLFLFFSVLSVFLSSTFPGSIITGRLFSIGSFSLILSLPLFWFLPFMTLMVTIVRIYDVRYAVDSRGIEAKTGILSMHQRITRVRYEDIRSIELEQTLLGRMLDIGDVEISTAATGAVEIVFQGIAAPEEVQDMLQRERDSRQKAAARAAAKITRSGGETASA